LLAVVVGEISARPSSEATRLIKTSEAEPGKWLTQEQILDLVRNRVNFMDITDKNFPTVTQDSSPKGKSCSEIDFNSYPKFKSHQL